MILNLNDYIDGILSLIAVIINIIGGIIILSRYSKFKRKEFLYIGIAFIGIYQSWWPTAVGFLTISIFGVQLNPAQYFFIDNFFIPIFITLWMFAMEDMIFNRQRHILAIIYFIISIMADIFLMYFLIIDTDQIGKLSGYFDAEYGAIMTIYLLFILSSIFTTATLFSLKSLKSPNLEIKLKGKFLILGFILYLITGFIDVGLIPLTTSTLILARVFLILSSIVIYRLFYA